MLNESRSGGWKSKIKVLVHLVSCENPLPDSQTAVFSTCPHKGNSLAVLRLSYCEGARLSRWERDALHPSCSQHLRCQTEERRCLQMTPSAPAISLQAYEGPEGRTAHRPSEPSE